MACETICTFFYVFFSKSKKHDFLRFLSCCTRFPQQWIRHILTWNTFSSVWVFLLIQWIAHTDAGGTAVVEPVARLATLERLVRLPTVVISLTVDQATRRRRGSQPAMMFVMVVMVTWCYCASAPRTCTTKRTHAPFQRPFSTWTCAGRLSPASRFSFSFYFNVHPLSTGPNSSHPLWQNPTISSSDNPSVLYHQPPSSYSVSRSRHYPYVQQVEIPLIQGQSTFLNNYTDWFQS